MQKETGSAIQDAAHPSTYQSSLLYPNCCLLLVEFRPDAKSAAYRTRSLYLVMEQVVCKSSVAPNSKTADGDG